MCSNIVVKTVVDGFVKKGFMFTAFDVTKFLRANGQNIRHSEVNTAVKEIYRDGEMTDYLREVKDVGAPVSPFVYYHQNADLDNYVSDWLENNPDQDGMKNDIDPATGIAQPSPSTLGSSATIVSTLPKVSTSVPNSDGRLYIAPIITSKVGLSPNQPVWITKKTGEDKLLIKDTPTGIGAQAKYVESDGRIRIGSTILRQISSTNNGYLISTDASDILIQAI